MAQTDQQTQTPPAPQTPAATQSTTSTAQTAPTGTYNPNPHPQSFLSMVWLPALIIIAFYFLLIRPQSKRAKAHRDLVSKISVGDEVVTAGGMVARVSKLKDNYVVLDVGKGTTITLQRSSIATVLPKGTMDTVE